MKYFRHFWSGYVRVQLTGMSPERFFNLCGSSGLELWNVSYTGEAYGFHIKARDFLSCGPYAKKAKVRLKILKKFGLPFFLRKNRGRKMWAAGFLSFFLLLYIMSLFVWDIDYRGNVTYTEDELTHYLETLDITCGIMKRKVSCDALEKELRNEFQGITWVSARLSGTRLYVHIKENEVPLEVPVKDLTPGDLMASCDGIITSIVVRSGVALVKAGDTVTKGQILVSGRIPITDDGGEVVAEHLVRADADIIGRVWRGESRDFSMWYKRSEKTGKVRKGLSLNLLDKSFVWLLPNFGNTEWQTVTQSGKLCLFGDFYLPVDYGLITSVEVSSYEEKYSAEQLNVMADRFKNEVSENLIEKGVQIIENNVKILVNGSICRFEVQLLTEESMEERSIIN